MASFITAQNVFCLVNANFIEIFCVSDGGSVKHSRLQCKAPKPVTEEVKEVKENDEIKDKHKVKVKTTQPDEGSKRVLACGLSRDARHLVACDDHKQIWVWRNDEPGTWNLVYRRELARRATAVTFSGSDVLVADKSGDVTVFSLLSDNEGELLLGHVSMLLDVTLIGQYVVTSDRDEKIRVSHYPNAYNIQSFCLGHTDFVSRLGVLRGADVLVSGSGDGTVRVWNPTSGSLLFTLDLAPEMRGADENDKNSSQSADSKVGQDGVTPDDNSDQSAGSKVGQDGVNPDGGDGIMSRAQGVADVMCLACCQRNNHVAIACHKKHKVLILKYNGDTSQPELHITQRLATPSGDVRGLVYDECGALWVVERNGEQSVRVYTYNTSSQQYEPLTPETDTRGVLQIAQQINSQHTQFFTEGAVACSTEYEHLHKVCVDNMAAYQQRKQERMREKAHKRGRAPEVSGNGEELGGGEAKNVKCDS